MISNTQDRFKAANWYNPDNPLEITLGGLGGIGSWFAIPAYKIGWRLFVYEDSFNTVDESNVGGQFYGEDQYGMDKVSALLQLLKLTGLENNYQVINMYSVFRENFIVFPIAVSAFDNMEARRHMFEGWKKSLRTKDKKAPAIFIDPRMTAETGLIYCVKNQNDVERYEAELFDDDGAQQLTCSYRATPHCGMRIASYIVQYICNQVSNKAMGENFRDVPFRTHINLLTEDRYEH